MEMRGKQDVMKALADGCCLCMCYLWLAKRNDGLLMRDVIECYNRGYIDGEAYVLKPEAIIKMVNGQKCSVSKRHDFPGETCIAWYSIDGKTGHFVVVNERGEIVFNPLGSSRSVKYGKPMSWRVVTYL